MGAGPPWLSTVSKSRGNFTFSIPAIGRISVSIESSSTIARGPGLTARATGTEPKSISGTPVFTHVSLKVSKSRLARRIPKSIVSPSSAALGMMD